MVQKTLSARSLSDAQGATILTGWIKVLPMFLIVVPGMISRVLYPDEVGCVDPEVCFAICQNPVSCSNIAFPKLVLGIMPVGMRGLMISVMIAALMSDLVRTRTRRVRSTGSGPTMSKLFIETKVSFPIRKKPILNYIKVTQCSSNGAYIVGITRFGRTALCCYS